MMRRVKRQTVQKAAFWVSLLLFGADLADILIRGPSLGALLVAGALLCAMAAIYITLRTVP